MTSTRETGQIDRKIPAPLLTRDQLDESVAPTAVQYDSRGCLLILMERAENVYAARFPGDHLRTVVLCPEAAVASCLPENVTGISGMLLELSGYLGVQGHNTGRTGAPGTGYAVSGGRRLLRPG
jgi:hypothetical protein